MKKKTKVKKKSSLPIRMVPSRQKKLALKSKRKPKKSLVIRKPISVGKKIKTKKVPTKRATNSIRKKVGPKAKSRVVSKVKHKPISKYRIVRIMGQGQFTVDSTTLKKLNEIDDSIVQLVSTERSDDIEFRKRLTELTSIVESNGQPLDPKEIIQSDIILPSTDLSIDEAKRLFKGEGVIPEI
ncbi:MAG: PspA-associated protein PspAA [Nitrososphaeraceae archaeon]